MSDDPYELVHPRLKVIDARIREAFRALGYEAVVVQSVRTHEYQNALYAKGRTTMGEPCRDPKPCAKHPMGLTVTNARGGESKHEPQPDGYGHALDYGFVNFANKDLKFWDPSHPWQVLGTVAKHLGCRWGGDFHTVDLGHIELP